MTDLLTSTDLLGFDPSSVAGIVMPSALAVLRFMIKSKCVGCSTGKSPGFSPLRILLICLAARTPQLLDVGAIRHQFTVFDVLAEQVNRWPSILQGEGGYFCRRLVSVTGSPRTSIASAPLVRAS